MMLKITFLQSKTVKVGKIYHILVRRKEARNDGVVQSPAHVNFFFSFLLDQKRNKKVKSAEIPPHHRVCTACRRCRPQSVVGKFLFVIPNCL
jgi:hypothetical protein